MSEPGVPSPPPLTTTTPSLATLAYAAPTHAKPRVALYRVAQVCWVLPLAFGLGILALFALTSDSMLPVLGLLTMGGGAVLFGIGVICVIVFMWLLGRCAPDERSRWRRRGSILLGLLVLNVPVAFGCSWTGVWLMNRFTVTVVNRTDAPVENLVVRIPGHPWDVGTVAPGASVSRTVSLNDDGDLTFSATHRGEQVTGEAGGYVGSFGSRSSGNVTFTSDGATAAIKHH